jgi:hypothetical protein
MTFLLKETTLEAFNQDCKFVFSINCEHNFQFANIYGRSFNRDLSLEDMK